MDDFGLASIPLYIRKDYPVATVSLTIGIIGAMMIFLGVKYRVSILKSIIASKESMIDRFKK